ncbi:HEXXH motif domain-containing protein [Micromonosporaceae bacterium B7E4]
MADLLAAERSWRMIQMRTLLDAVDAVPEAVGPLPPVAAAWELLVAAQRQDRSAVDALILHPQVGTWAGFTLRRLRGSTAARGPLWIDLGYLHALAVVAALRTGLGFTMRVPVRGQFVALPTLGGAPVTGAEEWDQAEITGSDGVATLTAAGTTVRIEASGVGTGGWIPLPTVRTDAGGHTLAVTLDFLDPYRNLRTPTPPQLMTAEQLARWRELLRGAWDLLMRVCPELAVPMSRGLLSVVPQPAAERFRTMSASAGDAFGSMIISEPEDIPEMAVTLVHEFQHIKLGGLLHLAQLLDAEPAQRLYAPWRDDPRPLGGLTQGVYAFVGIVQFWRAFRRVAQGSTARLAHFEFARWREQVRTTLDMMRTLPELTEVGRHLVTGLRATAAGWQAEDVPADILAAARAAATDHRIRWRIHHCRPDQQVVAELAAAFVTGADRPVVTHSEPVVATDPSARRLDTRAVLQLWRITDADGFEQLRRSPSAVGAQVSGATPADLAYVAGDLAQARELYLSELSADPGSPGAWAGLALAVAADRPHPAADAIRERPELVRAVHQEICRAGVQEDPLRVASWIGLPGGFLRP